MHAACNSKRIKVCAYRKGERDNVNNNSAAHDRPDGKKNVVQFVVLPIMSR